MEVILLERVRNLGNLGDKVNVKPGYGRNYLVPHGKAVFATGGNVEKFEARRTELENKAREVLDAAEQRATKLEGLEVSIAALASDEGKLFGSVSAIEIVDALAKQNIPVEKREILLPDGPMRTTGEFDIVLQLHSDVSATIKVVVTPEEQT